MKYHQITVSMAKDIVFSLGADLDDEEAGIFADGYNVAMHKVNKNASTELPNDASLSTNSPMIPEEIPKGLAGQIVSLLAHNIGDKFLAQKIWNACRNAMLNGDTFRENSISSTNNFREIAETSTNSPVISDGYALVPVEPTDEMIVAAMDSDDVTYNESDDTVFYVHHREIYKAMLAAAPKPETGPCTK